MDLKLKEEYVKMSELHEDPKNARRHNKKNIDLICKSLKEFSQYQSIIVQKGTGKIIAGNGTFRAAKSLGWKEIKCNVIEISDERASALAVMDNRTTDLSVWDNDVLGNVLDGLDSELLDVTGFDDNDIEKLLSRDTKDKKSVVSDVEEWNISDVDLNPAWIVIRTNTDYIEELLEFIESKSNLYRQLEFSCEGNEKAESKEQVKNISEKIGKLQPKTDGLIDEEAEGDDDD